MPDLQFSDVHSYIERFADGDTSINATSEQFSRAGMCAFLRENVAQLEGTVLVMTPAQLAYRLPGSPEGWDTSGDEHHFDSLEIITHVASGITFHWWGIARALGHPRPEFPRPPEGTTVTGKHRNMLGAGGWTGVPLPDALGLLQQTTDRFLAYIEGLPDGIDANATSSLGAFKHLTAHSWLFLDAVHAAMHLEQLREMQAHPDYPTA